MDCTETNSNDTMNNYSIMTIETRITLPIYLFIYFFLGFISLINKLFYLREIHC